MSLEFVHRIARGIVVGFLLLMTACSSLAAAEPTVEVVVPSVTAPPTTISTVSGPTLEPTVLPTLQPSLVPANQPDSGSVVVSACRDAAQYLSDDGLDGTTYAPNIPFTKTWTLKNTGTCTWDSSYLVYYLSGATMTQSPGYRIVPQGGAVAPGQSVNISVGMTSPPEQGSYQSYWGVKQENGSFLPIQGGANGNSFYVKIRVDDGTADGSITAASIDIVREEGSGTVCTPEATYFVSAYLTADGPTTAHYEISSSAGSFQTSPTGPQSPVVDGTLVFDQPGTQPVALRLAGPYPYPDDITVNLQVNGGPRYSAKLSCQG